MKTSRRFLLWQIGVKGLVILALVVDAPWELVLIFNFSADMLLGWQVFYPRAQLLSPTVKAFRTREAEVWLTIDDGPSPEDTPRMLELLASHEAKATFFLIGEHAEAHPELVRAMIAAGHEVGVHTWSHPVYRFWRAGPRRTCAEVERAVRALRELGVEPRLFRTPVGIKNLFLDPVLNAFGLRNVAWTVRSADTRPWAHATIFRRIERGLRPGAILLLHEGASVPGANRLVILEGTLQRLKARGYRAVLPKPEDYRP